MFSLTKDQLTFDVVKHLCQTQKLGGYISRNTACLDYANSLIRTIFRNSYPLLRIYRAGYLSLQEK